jgi:hypothetical protein
MSAKPDHDKILQMALLYDHMGLSCFPVPRKSKVPAKGFSWTEFRRRRPNRDELTKWFSDGDMNIAIVTGDVSERLAVRDFDETESFDRWKDHHRDFAKRLPTVKTARGYHVYARGQADGTVKFSDGEFRYNTYVLAPPSTHPTGIVYTWEQLIGDDIPTVDPVEAGLLTDWRQLGNTVNTGHFVSTVSTVLPKALDAAIRRTIPPNVGWRDTFLFKFCRELQAIPEYAGADPRSLEPIVRLWYERAEPHIGTKQFAVSFAAFIRAWANVKVPKDQTAVQAAFDRIKEADDSWIPALFDGKEMRLLIALCRELQSMQGQRPFFLDCRTAGGLLGVTHKTAWKWLDALCCLQVIRKVSSGTLKSRKANEYQFIMKG